MKFPKLLFLNCFIILLQMFLFQKPPFRHSSYNWVLVMLIRPLLHSFPQFFFKLISYHRIVSDHEIPLASCQIVSLCCVMISVLLRLPNKTWNFIPYLTVITPWSLSPSLVCFFRPSSPIFRTRSTNPAGCHDGHAMIIFGVGKWLEKERIEGGKCHQKRANNQRGKRIGTSFCRWFYNQGQTGSTNHGSLLPLLGEKEHNS